MRTPGASGARGADYEVVVVGAGQAGLAMGYLLSRLGLRFSVLERAASIASAWRERWDSLTLFTPRRFDSLPGLPFPGDPDGYPTRDEVIAYLERYAATFELPVELNSDVRRLAGIDGRFVLELDGRDVVADQVVVATGPFQRPFVPPLADRLAPEVPALHSTGYRRPGDLPEGTVLVVGGGNTGFQIAKELASSSRRVALSVGSRQTPLPQRILGRDLFWWLTKSRVLGTTVDSRLGQRLRTRDSLIGSSPRELRRRFGVELKARAVDADGRRVRFEDGSELDVDAVVWATGYRSDYSWIELPVLGPDGEPRHCRGVTGVRGLYFLGLTWQHTRGSALLGWVKDDAEHVADQVGDHVGARRESTQPPGGSRTMGRVLDHVDIRVSDHAASRRFYDTVLTVLGLERRDHPDHVSWGDFSIAADGQPVAKHLHIAFYAPSHELVDAFHRAGVEAGYTDDGAPGPRPQYREDYYGGFLRDPDGNSVEAVYTGRERKTGAIDHLWLRTRDVAAIKRFYVATGHEIGVDEPDRVQIVTADASISYVAGEPPTEHVHIAFGVDTNEAVDAFHRAALDAGYTDNGAPGERPAYHPGYYGAFVLDPDGHNIEAVNHNRTGAA